MCRPSTSLPDAIIRANDSLTIPTRGEPGRSSAEKWRPLTTRIRIVEKQRADLMAGLRQGEFDLIVTDYAMPLISGVEVIRFARSLSLIKSLPPLSKVSET